MSGLLRSFPETSLFATKKEYSSSMMFLICPGMENQYTGMENNSCFSFELIELLNGTMLQDYSLCCGIDFSCCRYYNYSVNKTKNKYAYLGAILTITLYTYQKESVIWIRDVYQRNA